MKCISPKAPSKRLLITAPIRTNEDDIVPGGLRQVLGSQTLAFISSQGLQQAHLMRHQNANIVHCLLCESHCCLRCVPRTGKIEGMQHT